MLKCDICDHNNRDKEEFCEKCGVIRAGLSEPDSILSSDEPLAPPPEAPKPPEQKPGLTPKRQPEPKPEPDDSGYPLMDEFEYIDYCYCESHPDVKEEDKNEAK